MFENIQFDIIISLSALSLAIYTAFLQRKHSYLSFKPLAQIKFYDFESRIAVRIANSGLGPMVITRFEATNQRKSSTNLIGLMPDLGPKLKWETYYSEIEGFTVLPNEELLILALSKPENLTSTIEFEISRDAIRSALSELEIFVHYEDFYGRRMPTISRSLSWFAATKPAQDPRI